jgi:hypothetical protein
VSIQKNGLLDLKKGILVCYSNLAIGLAPDKAPDEMVAMRITAARTADMQLANVEIKVH